ncbi:MAG: hypothetical protein DHS80DRAFT_20955 [Piptocephalis tieghemiana]|nr:MAG: hypothetical protein DHS80DRAFT_20955 [Piptocephalis tieghemiana]
MPSIPLILVMVVWGGWIQLAAGSFFQFDLTCQSTKDSYCENVRKTLELAGSYVEDVVKFSGNIRVNATVVEFANDLFYSQGRPSSTMVVKDSDGRYRLYPQALVREMNPAPAVQPGQQLTAYDVDIMINSKMEVYFPTTVTGSSKGIGKEEVDLSWTLTHELLHGLGHLTSWRDHSTTDQGADAQGASNATQYLTPYPFVYMVHSQSTGGTALQYDGYTYTYLFDRFLVETETPNKLLDDYAGQIDGVAKAGTTFADGAAFMSTVASNKAAADAASRVSQLARTPGSVGFRTYTGEIVTLDTDPSLPSSRLDHLGPKYEKTEDLLMYSVTPSGIEYTRAMNQAGGRHPLGERTQAILRTLGYKVQAPSMVLPLSVSLGWQGWREGTWVGMVVATVMGGWMLS